MPQDLMIASNHWRSAPLPNRHWTVASGLDAARKFEASTVQVERPLGSMRVMAGEGDSLLIGQSGKVPAHLTNRALGQLAGLTTKPNAASYLQTLPATLAAQNLNYGLSRLGTELHDGTGKVSKFYLHRAESDRLTALSVNSEIYDLVPHSVVLDAVQGLVDLGWRVPPGAALPDMPEEATKIATEDDCMPGSLVRPGTRLGPSGVYVYETKMFVIVIDPHNVIDDGTGNPLYAFSITYNATDGTRALGGLNGRISAICMNHILWGARDLNVWSVVHKHNKASEVAANLKGDLVSFATSANKDLDYKVIKAARLTMLGNSEDEVIERLLGKQIGVGKGMLRAAYQIADDRGYYGSPKSVWGMASGLTELSQSRGFAERLTVDMAAGRVMDLAAATVNF